MPTLLGLARRSILLLTPKVRRPADSLGQNKRHAFFALFHNLSSAESSSTSDLNRRPTGSYLYLDGDHEYCNSVIYFNYNDFISEQCQSKGWLSSLGRPPVL